MVSNYIIACLENCHADQTDATVCLCWMAQPEKVKRYALFKCFQCFPPLAQGVSQIVFGPVESFSPPLDFAFL